MHWEIFPCIIGIAVPMLLFNYLVTKGRKFTLRRLPMVDFVDEMVQSASELGRPIMIATGTKIKLGQTIYQMGFTILRYITRQVARLNVGCIITSAQPGVASVIVDWAKEGYYAAGHPDRFNLQNVYSFADGYHAEPLGNVALIGSENLAGVIYMNQTNWNFSIMPMGAGNLAGVVQAHVGMNPDAHTFASVLADRTLTGISGTVAMGMYLLDDPIENANMSAQDVNYILIIVVLWILFAIQVLGLEFW